MNSIQLMTISINYDDNDGLYEELVENILIEELTKEVKWKTLM